MVPEKIGKYTIDRLLAKGGMGAVFKAVHPELKRFVIIKKLSLRGGSFSERFKREAKILMDLNNNHIVHIYDYFVEGRSQYIVMEFVDGMSLAELRDRKKIFSPQMAVMIALDVAMALKYAHDKGVVHRDVKPGNILISKRGEIKLADFGIAFMEKAGPENGGASADKTGVPDSSADFELTGYGTALGTPAYMSPEQLSDSSSVDMRADVYSLGIVLYEMLTGCKSLAERPDRAIPWKVSRIVKKMTRKNPDRRFQSFLPVIKKMRAYLKAYQPHDIRVAMVRNMLTSDTAEKGYVSKNGKVRRICLIAACAVVCLFVAAAAWRFGIIHKTVLRWRYTPVNISMELPPGVVPGEDMRFKVFCFADDGKDIPEIKSAARILEYKRPPFVFSLFSSGTADSASRDRQGASAAHTLVCRTVYLPKGAYRVKITGGTRVWWRSFVVGREAVDIAPAFGTTASKPLHVFAEAYDADTGRRLPSARFYLVEGGKRTPLSRVSAESLSSGRIVRLRCEAEGYDASVFSLKIEWFQDELFLTAGLSPAQ